MPFPLFPDISSKTVDPLWFLVDKPVDEEAEVLTLEQEHQASLNSTQQQYLDLTPIGKTAAEHLEEEEEDDEEEDDNDDDTDSHDEEDDEELDMEVTYEPESPVDANIRIGSGSNHGVR